jgi:hypothetical protein
VFPLGLRLQLGLIFDLGIEIVTVAFDRLELESKRFGHFKQRKWCGKGLVWDLQSSNAVIETHQVSTMVLGDT